VEGIALSYPSITVWDSAEELPYDNGRYEAYQYTKLHVHLTAPWSWGVGILSSETNGIVRLDCVDKGVCTDWYLPGSISAHAGDVRLVLMNSEGLAVDTIPPVLLHVFPAHIDDDQYTEMLRSIGVLALSVQSHLNAPVSASTSEPWSDSIAGMALGGVRHHAHFAYRLLQLFRVIERNLPIIKHQPLKSMAITSASIRLPAPLGSTKALVRYAMNPSARRVLDIAPVESLDCPENAFIWWVIDHCSWLALGLAELLDLSRFEPPYPEIPIFRKSTSEEANNLNEGASKEMRLLNDARTADLERLAGLRAELLEWSRWGVGVLTLPPFSGIHLPMTAPPVTRRLTGTSGYSAIYHEFRTFQQTCGDLLDKGLGIFRLTSARPVKRTKKIYEIWCFAKLYESFVSVLRMRPPSDGRDILDALIIKDGLVELATGDDGLPLVRQGTESDEPTIKVRMVYDCKIERVDEKHRYLKPDIRIEVDCDEKRARFCFDAKYKNYFVLGYDEWEEDVIETAYESYLKRLDSKASFTLHPHEPSDYWGEIPFAEHSETCFGRSSTRTEYVGHQFGGIYFVPGESAELQCRKILSMMFGYHLNTYRLCTSCGGWLASGRDTQLDWKPDWISPVEVLRRSEMNDDSDWWGAVYCRCPKCHRFWVVQRCYGRKHLILKAGTGSIHKHSDKWDKPTWMYICPVCGSDPTREELDAVRMDYGNPEGVIPW
jgi:hypothetical protein